MISKILNVSLLGIALTYGLFHKDKIENTWSQSFAYYFPCRTVITYDINEFDPKFGISKEDFLASLKSAEEVWENQAGKELFKYEEGGRLEVNLVYDSRQQVTQQLKNMGVVVDNTKSSYESLKEKYDNLVAQYRNDRSAFDSKVSAFEKRKAAYESEVNEVNKNGGANKATYSRLNDEKNFLNKELSSINQAQNNLNKEVDEVNALASALNDLAKSLNMTVDKFNTIGATLGGEFEEGTFTSSASGQKINIYQFDNRTKLVRVLAHELGHALGLEHNDDSKAIMYRLNNGINEKLTSTDINDLKNLCGIE